MGAVKSNLLAAGIEDTFVVTGAIEKNGKQDYAALFFSANSDPMFILAPRGLVTAPVGSGYEELDAIHIAADSSSVLAAGFHCEAAEREDCSLFFMKFVAAGQLDTSYGTGGRRSSGISKFKKILASSFTPEGNFMFAGVFENSVDGSQSVTDELAVILVNPTTGQKINKLFSQTIDYDIDSIALDTAQSGRMWFSACSSDGNFLYQLIYNRSTGVVSLKPSHYPAAFSDQCITSVREVMDDQGVSMGVFLAGDSQGQPFIGQLKSTGEYLWHQAQPLGTASSSTATIAFDPGAQFWIAENLKEPGVSHKALRVGLYDVKSKTATTRSFSSSSFAYDSFRLLAPISETLYAFGRSCNDALTICDLEAFKIQADGIAADQAASRKVSFGMADTLTSVLPFPDGSILQTGITDDGSVTKLSLQKLTPAGQPDASFGVGGVVQIPRFFVSWPSPPGKVSYGFSFLLPNSKIVVVQQTDNTDLKKQIQIVRLLPDGKLDKTFNASGALELETSSTFTLTAAALGPSGKLYIAGVAFPSFGVLTFSFETAKIDRFAIFENLSSDTNVTTDIPQSVVLTPEGGGVLVGKRCAYDSNAPYYKAPCDPALIGFGPDLKKNFKLVQQLYPAELAPATRNDSAVSAVFEEVNDRQALVVLATQCNSNFGCDPLLMRYWLVKKNGSMTVSLDTNVGKSGLLLVPFYENTVLDQIENWKKTRGIKLVRETSGKILVGVESENPTTGAKELGLARFLPGVADFDQTFAANGRLGFKLGEVRNALADLAVQADGKILIGGSADDDFALMRVEP